MKYRIMNDQVFRITKKDGEPCKISSLALSAPQIHPTKSDNKKAPKASEKVPKRKLIWLKKSGAQIRSGRKAKFDRDFEAP